MNFKNITMLCLSTLFLLGCETNNKNKPTKYLNATWYGIGDGSGSRTANGEKFDPYDHTAAHKTLPFNTQLKIINPVNNRHVIVRINDRGPFVRGVDIDLTKGSANAIGMTGTQKIIVEEIERK